MNSENAGHIIVDTGSGDGSGADDGSESFSIILIYTIEDQDQYLTLAVGDEGTMGVTFPVYNGVQMDQNFRVSSSQGLVFDEQLHWKAVKSGIYNLNIDTEYTEESMQKLQDSLPEGTEIYLLSIAKVDTPVEIGERVYRVYNPNSGEHFYTVSGQEKDNLVNAGWKYEGVSWTGGGGVSYQFNAPRVTENPVYRLYNPNAGDHHFTLDEDEKNMLVDAGWKYEGVSWYSCTDIPFWRNTDKPLVYRLYNPNAASGAHHYTLSEQEKENLINAGWLDEGTCWTSLR